MYNLNYTPTTLGGTELKRNYIWGYANKKNVNTTALMYTSIFIFIYYLMSFIKCDCTFRCTFVTCELTGNGSLVSGLWRKKTGDREKEEMCGSFNCSHTGLLKLAARVKHVLYTPSRTIGNNICGLPVCGDVTSVRMYDELCLQIKI
jgi:hypothetical protein